MKFSNTEATEAYQKSSCWQQQQSWDFVRMMQKAIKQNRKTIFCSKIVHTVHNRRGH